MGSNLILAISRSRKLILFVIEFAFAFSGLAFATNDTIRADRRLISGMASDIVRSFESIPVAVLPLAYCTNDVRSNTVFALLITN